MPARRHSCMLRVAVGARRGLAGSAAGLRGGGARIAAAILSDGISTLARRPGALPRRRTSPPRASRMDFLEGFRLGATRDDARAAAAAAAAVRTLAAARAAEGDEKRKRDDDDDDDEWHVSDSEDERRSEALGVDTKEEESIASVKREQEEEVAAEEGETKHFLGGSYGDAVAIDAATLGYPTKTAVAASKSKFFLHPRKNSRTSRGDASTEPHDDPSTEPPGWRPALDAVRTHRSNRTASVDEFHEFLLSLRASPDAHFQALVASLLSVQCRDAVALGAMRSLRVALGGECTVDAVVNAPDGVVEEAIRRCNYGRTKARYVRGCADAIVDRFDGATPAELDALTSLPGVGPKIARLVASVAFGDDRAGMVVDTHVRRVAGRLGWTRPGRERSSAESTRRRLEAWLPPDLWAETTQLLVGFGQETCAPRVPRCGECPLSGSCPSSTVKTTASGTDVEDL